MNILDAIIVDDEPSAIKMLKFHLQEFPFVNIVAEADSIDDAEKEILYNKPDLLFLDIQLHGESIFTMLENLKSRDLNFGIVFITAYYDDYLKDAIDACGIHYDRFSYIEKPISSEKLSEPLLKFKQLFDRNSGEKLKIKHQNGIEQVSFENIFYCESSGNQSTIQLTNGSYLISSDNLSKLIQSLPEKSFYRMSSQYIINLDHVRKIEKKGNKYFCTLAYQNRKEDLIVPEKKWRHLKNLIN